DPGYARRGEGLPDEVLGEDVAERQIPTLGKLAPQKLHLGSQPSRIRMTQPWGLLAVMEWLSNTIYAREAICICHRGSVNRCVKGIRREPAFCVVSSGPR